MKKSILKEISYTEGQNIFRTSEGYSVGTPDINNSLNKFNNYNLYTIIEPKEGNEITSNLIDLSEMPERKNANSCVITNDGLVCFIYNKYIIIYDILAGENVENFNNIVFDNSDLSNYTEEIDPLGMFWIPCKTYNSANENVLIPVIREKFNIGQKKYFYCGADISSDAIKIDDFGYFYADNLPEFDNMFTFKFPYKQSFRFKLLYTDALISTISINNGEAQTINKNNVIINTITFAENNFLTFNITLNKNVTNEIVLEVF